MNNYHYFTKEEREQFKELSLKAFGNKSRWTKLYQRGWESDMTETLKDGTERKYRGTKFPTKQELIDKMTDLIDTKAKEDAEKAKKALEVKTDPLPEVNNELKVGDSNV